MLTLTEIGTVFALVGGTVFYVLLTFLAKREKTAGNRDLQRQVETQAAQIQAIEARLRYVEAALCGGEHAPGGGTPSLPPGNWP